MSESEPAGARDTALAEVLNQAMAERGLSLSQLVARSGVPKTTVYRWLTGGSVRPYQRANLLRVGVALGLHRVEANRLLHAAGLPSLAVLATAAEPDELEALAFWSATARTNLPAALTPFVGRAQDIAEIGALLCQDTVRLVTLTGTGGSGKTRLAIRVAQEVDDVFDNGVFFVRLATIRDPELLIPTIAAAVGLRRVIDAALPDRLIEWIRQRRVLLLLDNLEQLADGSSIIVDLLREASGLTVLATSRIPLHLTGEFDWPVRPFPLPLPETPRQQLAQNPAVALFLQRAYAANPHRPLDVDELPRVAEICSRLDGLPLAIELAAARMRDRDPAQLLADFPSRLDLSSDGPRDAPMRQQTLRDTIAWSLDLLPESLRTFLLRLCVFVGGWTAEAAQMVCLPDARPDGSVDKMLQTLVYLDLIQQIPTPAGTTRYGMLETIREYGQERMAESTDEAVLRNRHARYFLALAETGPPYIPEARPDAWYARIDANLDNIRAALDWTSSQDGGEQLIRFAVALWPYWHEYVGADEGRRWLETALARRDELSLNQRASLLTGACVLASGQFTFRDAEALGLAALDLWRKLGDHRGQALILRQLGWGSYLSGVSESSVDLFAAALEEWREVGDPRGIALALSDLGLAHCVLGNSEATELYLKQAEAEYRRLGDETGLGRVQRDSGLHALLRGDLNNSIALLNEAVHRLQETDRSFLLPGAMFYLGAAYCFAGKLAVSVTNYRSALAMPGAIEDKGHVALTLLGFAAVAARQRDGARSAAILCGASQAIQQANQIVLPPAVSQIYSREMHNVRDAVGEVAFAEAFDAGSQMTMAEALAFAYDATGEE